MSTPKSLEKALPNLIAKLKDFNGNLNAEEQVVFAEILESAALHTDFVQADDEGRHDKKLYMKPKSAHATTEMKRQYHSLPELVGTPRLDS